ncbi:MAG: hypothetical protein IJE40_04145 [Clostridia bacterium]|nr:hypothetical protein [Clostridia bacterium]
MKMRSIKTIVIITLIITITLFVAMFTINAKEDYQLNNMTLNDVAAVVYNEIPVKSFGGMYIDNSGNLVVNVVDTDVIPRANKASMNRSMGKINIIYKTVEKSLQELTAVQQALIPYMIEYGIAILDANDVTNLVDITLNYDHPKSIEELEALVETFIDLKYVNITVLPDGTQIELT